MNGPMYFDDLRIGDTWRSRARTITEVDIVNFAGITGDYDSLHVDYEFAAKSPYGKPIAHGLLGLSFVAGLGSHSPWVYTVAFVRIDQWRFTGPIFIGDTVHVLTEVLAKENKGRQTGLVSWRRQLINQHGHTVQDGTLQTLVRINQTQTAPKSASTTAAPHKPAAELSSK